MRKAEALVVVKDGEIKSLSIRPIRGPFMNFTPYLNNYKFDHDETLRQVIKIATNNNFCLCSYADCGLYFYDVSVIDLDRSYFPLRYGHTKIH